MPITKIGSLRLGKIKPYLSITRAMTSALENRHANSSQRVAKLGDAFYLYFTQPLIAPYESRLHWQDDLATQLCKAMDFKSIHPGGVDSHGWMSVIVTSYTAVYTTSLIREAADGLSKTETFITPLPSLNNRINL